MSILKFLSTMKVALTSVRCLYLASTFFYIVAPLGVKCTNYIHYTYVLIIFTLIFTWMAVGP